MEGEEGEREREEGGGRRGRRGRERGSSCNIVMITTHLNYSVPVEVIFSWQILATFDPSEWRVCCRCMLFCRSVLTVLLCRRKGLGDTYHPQLPSPLPSPSSLQLGLLLHPHVTITQVSLRPSAELLVPHRLQKRGSLDARHMKENQNRQHAESTFPSLH